MTCRRTLAKPYPLPPMPPFPTFRINESRPFSHIAKAFIHILRRFISRRGLPQSIISDNGTQFKLPSKVTVSCSLVDYCTRKGIDRKFITELAPWQCGVYERLIGIFKQIFRRAIERRLLNIEDLITITYEIEATVNSRPLTYHNDDISLRPLRPTDFILPGNSCISTPIVYHNNDEDYLPVHTSHNSLINKWAQSQICANNFWNIWHKEYLNLLRENGRWDHKHPRSMADDIPKVTRIHELLNNSDICSAKILLPNRKILNRSINFLYPLEIRSSCPECDTGTDISTHQQQHKTTYTQVDEGTKIYTSPRRSARIALLHPKTYIYFIYILYLISIISSINTKCDNTTQLQKLIYLQECGRSGIAIYSTKDELYCFKNYTCDPGTYLHISNNEYTCGFPCDCPKWASHCTTLIAYSVIINTTISLCCIEVSNVEADTNSCNITTSGSLECQYDTSTILTVSPNNQTLCLSFLDSMKQVVGSLQITIPPIHLLCRYKSLFFTQDHTFRYPFIKRCSLMRPCANNYCETIKPEDPIPELSNDINNTIGFSYCMETCGCFLCTPACLFYRIIPDYTSRNIYEVFTCSTYDTEINTMISLQFNEHSPGQDSVWNNISFNVVSTSLPTMPILSTSYLRDIRSNQIRILPLNPVGEPQAGVIGQLQCQSKLDAEQSNCIFDPNVCKCQSAADTVTCQCTSFNHSQLLLDNEFALPLSLGNVNLRIDNERILKAEVTSSTTTQLQITISNLRTVLKRHDNTCNVTASSFYGCYHCSVGAIGNLTCYTDFGEIYTELRCEHQHFNVKCTRQGHTSQLNLYSSSAVLHINCNPHYSVYFYPTTTTGFNTFKQGIMIEKKLLPSEHKVIEERAQVILNECPYLDLIGEVGHLYSALKLLHNEVSSKLETCKMVSSEQNREPIMDKIQIKEETSRPKQVDAGSAPDYFTSDEESDSSIRRRITRKPKERTIKFHRNVNKTLKNQTRRDIKESGNTDLAIKGTWNIEDLIKFVTTLTKNNNEGNRAKFPEIKIPIYNGDKHKYEEFWAVFHQMNLPANPFGQLKAVGRDISKDSDPLWKEIIYDKFPNHIREKVYMAMKRDKETKWTINKMISYIDDLIAARETYEGGEDVHSESESNKKPYQNDIKRIGL
uniref:Integrase catalytic domain-containing protein n=1 Tax=Heterorhabditis bacteriophora TaxID=37862 RepID=A0A1I7WVR7_HETBA